MIEDMKMLITDMDRKVDLLMEKIPEDDASAGSKTRRSKVCIIKCCLSVISMYLLYVYPQGRA